MRNAGFEPPLLCHLNSGLVHGGVPGDELDVLLCQDGLPVDAAHDGQLTQTLNTKSISQGESTSRAPFLTAGSSFIVAISAIFPKEPKRFPVGCHNF